MEEPSSIFRWVPPDGGTDSGRLMKECSLLIGDDWNTEFEAEAPFKGSVMQQKACSDQVLDDDIPDCLLSEANKLLEAEFPDLPMSLGKLGALEQHQDHSNAPQDPSSVGLFLEDNSEGCDTIDYITSGMDGDLAKMNGGQVGVPSLASRGKTGSQAFHYIKPAAVLETHGIPAPSRLALMLPACSDPCLYKPIAQSIDPKLTAVKDEAITIPTHFTDPSGTLCIDPKPVTVPDKATSILTYLTDSSSTLSTNDILITVPGEATSIPTYLSEPCGTLSTDDILSTVPDKVTSTSGTNTEVCDSPKKRRRRRRKADGEDVEIPKARLYEKGPLSDEKEERKRRDAIRAKLCREKNRREVQVLREKLAEMEKKNEQMAQELVGRRSYEEVLLGLLREKHGILVTPFGAPRQKLTLTAL